MESIETGKYRGFDLEVRDPGIAVITFNQPERLNGMSWPVKRDLAEIMAHCQLDQHVRVVVITGTGRAFSAGDDITDREASFEGARPLMPEPPAPERAARTAIFTYGSLRWRSQALNLAVRSLDKVTIAAINGVAIQSGLSLALACDFRLASSDARLGSATLRFGYQPDEGGHYLLVQHIGLAKATDFVLRKRIVPAAEALQLGLVHEVTEPEQLMDRALGLARELAGEPQVAVRLAKRALLNATELTFYQALDDIATKTAVSDYHEDAHEGRTSFKEKRRPRFNRWLE